MPLAGVNYCQILLLSCLTEWVNYTLLTSDVIMFDFENGWFCQWCLVTYDFLVFVANLPLMGKPFFPLWLGSIYRNIIRIKLCMEVLNYISCIHKIWACEYFGGQVISKVNVYTSYHVILCCTILCHTLNTPLYYVILCFVLLYMNIINLSLHLERIWVSCNNLTY